MKAVSLFTVSVLLAAAGCVEGPDVTSGDEYEPPEPIEAGIAAVSIYSYGAPASHLAIAAGYKLREEEDVCSTETRGACTIYTCSRSTSGGQPVTTGTITVTVGGNAVTIEPSGSGTYAPMSEGAPAMLHGGELVEFEVEAAGSVPYHEASVIAPSPITLTSPALGEPMELDRASDLELDWEGGTSGEVLFVVGVMRPDGSLVSESCRFPATRGRGLIPASTLELLPVSEPGGQTLSFLWVMGRTEVQAGPWRPAFSAVVEALGPDGRSIAPNIEVR